MTTRDSGVIAEMTLVAPSPDTRIIATPLFPGTVEIL